MLLGTERQSSLSLVASCVHVCACFEIHIFEFHKNARFGFLALTYSYNTYQRTHTQQLSNKAPSVRVYMLVHMNIFSSLFCLPSSLATI